MAKPGANRVIIGTNHEHTHTPMETYIYTHTHTIPKCINLLAPAARYSSINTFCQGYSERRCHAALYIYVCVISGSDSRKRFKAELAGKKLLGLIFVK